MKKENKLSLAVALCFLVVGTAISVLKIAIDSPILSAIFAVGLSLSFVSLYKHFKFGEGVEQDERTKKVMYRALEGSWFATLIVVIALMFADRFYAGLSVQNALSIIFFFMVFTFSGLNWYFEQKGDIE